MPLVHVVLGQLRHGFRVLTPTSFAGFFRKRRVQTAVAGDCQNVQATSRSSNLVGAGRRFRAPSQLQHQPGRGWRRRVAGEQNGVAGRFRRRHQRHGKSMKSHLKKKKFMK